MAKFYGNILSLNENIAKSFRGATFLTYTVYNLISVQPHRSTRSSHVVTLKVKNSRQ